MKNCHENARITTLEPQGHVTAVNANDFFDHLQQVVKTEESSILLVDMKQVEFLDSAGLMALVKAFRFASSLGRNLSLCSLAPSVKMVLELTQLDRVFDIFENRDAFHGHYKLLSVK